MLSERRLKAGQIEIVGLTSHITLLPIFSFPFFFDHMTTNFWHLPKISKSIFEGKSKTNLGIILKSQKANIAKQNINIKQHKANV